MPRILIADDRATMRNTLRNLFTLYRKWDVCGEAVDGRQAVDAAVTLKPDLVLLDYKMPNGNGIEAALELKQKLPNTPVVIFTLYKTSELESQARKAGVRAVIGKEEGVMKLLYTIEEAIGILFASLIAELDLAISYCRIAKTTRNPATRLRQFLVAEATLAKFIKLRSQGKIGESKTMLELMSLLEEELGGPLYTPTI